ncbi:MAG: hypothetical protein ACPGVG_20175 [Mycobacterium sp.]
MAKTTKTTEWIVYGHDPLDDCEWECPYIVEARTAEEAARLASPEIGQRFYSGQQQSLFVAPLPDFTEISLKAHLKASAVLES